ncbi:uncharacterized protein LOC116928484 isoform X4 [Daphnia magna]|uniref:uncharacterized protein LOC116928484 isoform X4 n=1 Tax=Daphnia magna TaxID=35525 RepID=UPI001E1BC2C1|nr:uncharacterized protein LOC116928484 isoform X4 [Daphnia magna]
MVNAKCLICFCTQQSKLGKGRKFYKIPEYTKCDRFSDGDKVLIEKRRRLWMQLVEKNLHGRSCNYFVCSHHFVSGSLGQDTQLLSLPTVQHECETQQEKTSSSPTIELGSASHCLDANLSVGDETASATTDEHEETTNDTYTLNGHIVEDTSLNVDVVEDTSYISSINDTGPNATTVYTDGITTTEECLRQLHAVADFCSTQVVAFSLSKTIQELLSLLTSVL